MAVMLRVILILTAMGSAQGQWILQDSHSTASLRGVHSVGRGVAWASGTSGTVLRTTDGGATWQTCAVPLGAGKLDFRGVQAFDADAALVMSSGPGDLSRIYKTTDGCRTWKLVFSNPDKEGFWDALQFSGRESGVLVGDPVDGRFPVFSTADGGDTWKRGGVAAEKGQSLFAASNSSLLIDETTQKLFIVTGGGTSAFIEDGAQSRLPLAAGPAAGAFSLGSRVEGGRRIFVAVGGDYKLADETAGTAASRTADGLWHAADVPPHGYRSAVAYSPETKTWIAVGPNGTDISSDDGRTWKALLPDTERNWNALSLPFVVGSKGRIGRLKP
jgi:photosystem II stability/assembly factor-like uncharacterized protein